jgi:iron(III) transport system substrate-binding protein
MTDVTNAFITKKYGVKVTLWRGGSEEIMQRVITESRGGRGSADVMETAGPNIEAANREKLLAPMETPLTRRADTRSIRKEPAVDCLAADRVHHCVHNRTRWKKADAPKSFAELADPKWKGKLGIEADDDNWLMTMSAPYSAAINYSATS